MPKLTTVVDHTADSHTKVVLVTMDNHLSGAFDHVSQKLLATADLRFKMHAASDWRNNPSAVEKCRDDIGQADIVIVTMLFMEDHIQAVMPALLARRETCDAMVCFMSAGEVIKLTRMGRFSRAAEPVTPMLSGISSSSRPPAS